MWILFYEIWFCELKYENFLSVEKLRCYSVFKFKKFFNYKVEIMFEIFWFLLNKFVIVGIIVWYFVEII